MSDVAPREGIREKELATRVDAGQSQTRPPTGSTAASRGVARSRRRAVTVEDIWRCDRACVERIIGRPIRTLAPWPLKAPR